MNSVCKNPSIWHSFVLSFGTRGSDLSMAMASAKDFMLRRRLVTEMIRMISPGFWRSSLRRMKLTMKMKLHAIEKSETPRVE